MHSATYCLGVSGVTAGIDLVSLKLSAHSFLVVLIIGSLNWYFYFLLTLFTISFYVFVFPLSVFVVDVVELCI